MKHIKRFNESNGIELPKDRTEYRKILYNADVNDIKKLIDNGFDVNFDDGFPLRAAAKVGKLNTVKLLIENGADLMRKEGMALQWAAEYGHIDVVNFLLPLIKDSDTSGNIPFTRYKSIERALKFVTTQISVGKDIESFKTRLDNLIKIKEILEQAL